MSDYAAQVAELDELAKIVNSNRTEDTPQELKFIEALPQRDDAIQLMHAIFSYSQESMIMMAAVRILGNIIYTQWNDLSPDDRLNLRQCILGYYEQLPMVRGTIEKRIVEIALRQYPQEWPDFLNYVFSGSYPHFVVLSEFVSKITNPEPSFLTADRLKEILDAFQQALPEICPIIFGYFPDEDAGDVVINLVPLLSWNDQLKSLLNTIIDESERALFRPLVEIMLIPDIPADTAREYFNFIVSSLPDEMMALDLVPILQQHLSVFEHQDSLASLSLVHEILLTMEFSSVSEYWELLLLSVYEDVSKGDLARLSLHSPVLNSLRDILIANMPPPPDYLKAVASGARNQSGDVLLDQQSRVMLLCLAYLDPGMMQKSLIDAINRGHYSQSGEADSLPDPQMFERACFALSALSSTSLLDNVEIAGVLMMYAIEATTLSNTYLHPTLFMAAAFCKNGVFAPELIRPLTAIALKALSEESSFRLSAMFLSAAARTGELYGLVNEDILSNTFYPETYTLLCEAVIIAGGNVIDAVISRFPHDVNSFSGVREARLTLAGLTGLARTVPEDAVLFIRSLLPIINQTQPLYLETIENLYVTDGDSVLGRDDIKLMLGFIRGLSLMYCEVPIPDAKTQLEVFRRLPPKLRPPETILLAEKLVQTGILLDEVYEYVMYPLLEMLSGDLLQFMDHVVFAPLLVSSIARCDPDRLTFGEIELLLHILPQGDQKVVINATSALINVLQVLRETQKIALLELALPKILSLSCVTACEPSHRFCFVQLIELIFSSVQITNEGIIDPEPSREALETTIMTRYPIIDADLTKAIIVSILSAKTVADQEKAIIKLVSSSKQSSTSEIVRQVRLIKITNHILSTI